MKISREDLVAAGLALVEERGLAKLNMRALADRLGMQQSSLYWYVRNKDELMGLMIASLYRQALDAAPPAADWREWLIGFGCSFRAVLRRHRDASRMCALVQPVFEDQDRAAEAFMAELTRRGVPADLALSYEASVVSLVIGWVVVGANRPLHARLAGLIDEERAFDLGLRAMVAGLPDGTDA